MSLPPAATRTPAATPRRGATHGVHTGAKSSPAHGRLRRFFYALFLATAFLLVPPSFGGLGVLSLAAHSGAADSEDAPAEPALHLDTGSIARSRLVALGRDLVVEGEAESHAVALGGSVTVMGRVEGDVIVLGGNATLGESATVGGDVFVLGGRIDAAPGSEIRGRSVAYPDAAAAWLTLLEGPTTGTPTMVVLGAKLALLAFWALLVTLLFAISGREIVSTAESVRAEPFHNFVVGLTGILAMTMTAVAASALVGAIIGLPLLVLVSMVALLLRFWGMVAVFHALGSWLLDRTRGRHRVVVPVTAATVGLIVLGAVKLVPWLGDWTWMLATFIGVGAAMTTKLGRNESWLAPA